MVPRRGTVPRRSGPKQAPNPPAQRVPRRHGALGQARTRACIRPLQRNRAMSHHPPPKSHAVSHDDYRYLAPRPAWRPRTTPPPTHTHTKTRKQTHRQRVERGRKRERERERERRREKESMGITETHIYILHIHVHMYTHTHTHT